MSTLLSRLYSWATDKTNNVKITAARVDAENDQLIVAVNRKVLCSGSVPGSPIAGQTWVDTTNKVLKIYRNNEWVIMGAVHVAATASVMATPQEGDLWYDTTLNLLKAYDGSAWSTVGQEGTISLVIEGGGAAISTGIIADLEIPFACTITQATALADQSGSIVVDVWMDTYANFPPTDADTITASAPVTITTATKSQDATLTGWTVAIPAGSVLRFNVDSCTSITRCLVSLKYKRT